MDNSILRTFLGRAVRVKVEGLTVRGKLVAFSGNTSEGHRPLVLVLKTDQGSVLVRGNWESLSIES